MSIPRNNVATCLVKWKRICAEQCILVKGLHLLNAKRLPDHREDLSFCRPTFQVRRLLF